MNFLIVKVRKGYQLRRITTSLKNKILKKIRCFQCLWFSHKTNATEETLFQDFCDYLLRLIQFPGIFDILLIMNYFSSFTSCLFTYFKIEHQYQKFMSPFFSLITHINRFSKILIPPSPIYQIKQKSPIPLYPIYQAPKSNI